MQKRQVEADQSSECERPPTAVPQVIVFAGLASLSIALLALRKWPIGDAAVSLFILLAATATPMLALDVYLNRQVLFRSRPLRPSDPTRLRRVGIKLLGLVATFAIIAIAYWAFPIYRDGQATIVWSFVRIVALPFVLITPVYIWLTDARMEEPEDGLYMAGQAVLGRWDLVDRNVISQYTLGWLVKAYFTPIMLSYAFGDISWELSPASLSLAQEWPYGWYKFAYRVLFFSDLCFASIGYLCTFRLFDTHIRSTDRTGSGWAVCLACYAPFWFMIRSEYLNYWGMDWSGWVGDNTLLGLAWAGSILVVTLALIWTDASFGVRFSNLTYRGLLTSGPYRWSKHPGYLCKNIHWWLISVPFLTHGSPLEAVRHCLLLGLVSALYWGRAKTEEIHLLRAEPEYRAYANFIERHGLIAIIKRHARGLFRRLTSVVQNL